jgi:hypothetical protein
VLLAAVTRRLARCEITEESMVPALLPGDSVLAAERPRSLSPGDVIVFELRPGFEVVKRVGSPPPGVEGLWLLGDNPGAGSVDSRTLGPIDPGRVRARVLVRYRPLPLKAIS